MSNALQTLTSKIAQKFDMGDGSGLTNTLKATCFKGGTQVTDDQMTALLLVAQQYNLNPFTKEIYAFPDKGGIVPVVGVDGWSRIINEHPQFDGMDFDSDHQQCTCIIYRKDRSHPIKVTEYMEECKRTTGPWSSHPRRMLRHKAMIQCARLAFGYVGIYEQDEAERIVESNITTIDGNTGEVITKREEPKALSPYPAEQLEKNLSSWADMMAAGKSNAQGIIDKISSRYTLSAEQITTIKSFDNVIQGETA